jgi:MFS superfamily sulfate permease-like transporter
LPGPAIAVIIGTMLSYLLNHESFGISLVGKIPAVLPSPSLQLPEGITLYDLAEDGFGIFLISFGSGIITARSFATKNRYRLNANQELIAFGLANVAAGVFGGFPVTGADSRTAVNDTVGGCTQVAGLVAAALLTLVLLTLTDVMKYLPVAALGAIIASAAIDLFDAKELRRLWQTSQAEFLFALVAMLSVVAFGVLRGILIAIVTTGVYLLTRISRPSDALLGCIPGQSGSHTLHREPRAEAIPGLAKYLVQSSLLFFNIDYVRDRIRWIVNRLPTSTQWFILDAQAVPTVDSTAAAVLGEIREELLRRNLQFGMANLHGQPRELLGRSGLLSSIGPEICSRVLRMLPSPSEGRMAIAAAMSRPGSVSASTNLSPMFAGLLGGQSLYM